MRIILILHVILLSSLIGVGRTSVDATSVLSVAPPTAAPGTYQIEQLMKCNVAYTAEFMDSLSIVIEANRLQSARNYIMLSGCSRVVILSRDEITAAGFTAISPVIIYVEYFNEK